MPTLPHATDVLSHRATGAPAARSSRSLVIGLAHPAFSAVGGAEVLLSRYVRFLRERGHRVRIVTRRIDARVWPELGNGVDLRRLPNHWSDHLGVPGTHPEIERRCARHAAALAGCDVILAGNHPANMIAARVDDGAHSLWACMEPSRRLYPSATLPTLTERLIRTARVNDTPMMRAMRDVIVHDLRGGRNDANAAQRGMDRMLVPRIARLSAISEFTAANLRRIYDRTVDEIVYPTINVVPAPSRAPGISRDGLRVLVHGRMDIVKNVETVIRGFATFQRRRAGAHELHLVGEGADLIRLIAVTRELELSDVVHVHGFVPSTAMEELYARCDVMAALPIDEPFGMVFPEAALRGLLLVGPNHGGPREILDDGRYGWAVDAFSPDALAGALDEIWKLSDGDVSRRRISARDACARRYSPEATLPAVERMLSECARAAR